MFLKIKLFFLLFLIFSCQPVEIREPIKFDNSGLEKILFNADKSIINIKYNPLFSEQNIEDQINNPPIKVLQSWMKDNISFNGNENILIINIIDASIYRKEIENVDAQKYEEKTIYLYQIFFLVEYELYDNDKNLLANATVENYRSTTSQKFISLNETENIINDLIFLTLKDFTNESKSMINLYMGKYIN